MVKSKICDAYAPSQEPVKNHVRGPHKILVLVGLNGIKILAVLGERVIYPAFLWRDYLCHSERKKGTPRDTVYPWGKGAHKQKSERYRTR